MDEPTAALTEADVHAAVRHRAAPEGPRRRRRLHQPSARRDLRRSPTASRCCATAPMSTRRSVAETSATELVQMMVGRRDRQPLSQDRRADRRAGSGGARHRAPADDQRRQPDRARRRDRRPRRPRRLRAQRTRAGACSASRPAESGEIRLDGRGGQDRLRRSSARAQGIAYVPEDRGVQGLVRPMSVLHNLSLAALGAPFAGRLHRSRRRAALGGSGDAALQRQDELARRDRWAALGRQPAEDRARQMARQQSQAAHPRRADARHRRRRQGRDPPPDERTRRARASRS